MPAGPLEGIQIVDFSIALTGPYSTALLADQGANVVKIERPGLGDVARWIGVAVEQISAFYLVCNRGKRGIALDFEKARAREIALTLCQQADVVVQNFRPGVMDRLGLGYEEVKKVNPDIIYASLSGYGSVGPYRDRSAYDAAIQAYSGLTMVQADPDVQTPTFLRQSACDKFTALFAAQAISAALFARERGCGGQHLELSMTDAVVSILWPDSAGNEALLDSDRSMHSVFGVGKKPMRFRDGWGVVVPTSDHDFVGMCIALGVDGYDDPRVATMGERRKNRFATARIIERCEAKAAEMTQEEVTKRFEAERVPFAMVLTLDELTRDPQAIAMGLFVEGRHPIAGRDSRPTPPNAVPRDSGPTSRQRSKSG